MRTEVCSIYLFRDEQTLELCATEGLNRDAVHQTRMKLGEGLVGRVARTGKVINTDDAPAAPGFRYMPETGEEAYCSFMGVPVQRLGETLGVLVVQSKQSREYSDEELYAVEVVAMVIAEMAELGAFVGEGAAMSARHQQPVLFRGGIARGRGGTGPCLAARTPRRRDQPDRRGPHPRVGAPRRSRGRPARRCRPHAQHSGHRRQGTASGARSLPHVRQLQGLDEADGRGHRTWPVGRGGG